MDGWMKEGKKFFLFLFFKKKGVKSAKDSPPGLGAQVATETQRFAPRWRMAGIWCYVVPVVARSTRSTEIHQTALVEFVACSIRIHKCVGGISFGGWSLVSKFHLLATILS